MADISELLPPKLIKRMHWTRFVTTLEYSSPFLSYKGHSSDGLREVNIHVRSEDYGITYFDSSSRLGDALEGGSLEDIRYILDIVQARFDKNTPKG